MEKYKLKTSFQPAGDQPHAIKELVQGVKQGNNHQVLLGVTGSGKTFTIANVIQELNMPLLVISPNKTLAAQLYVEFKNFFPDNPVEYFISYYDYYQPEAYIPQSDTYIEKDAAINERIERLRLKATSSLFEKQNSIVVASVSCIYGLGNPEDYSGMVVNVRKGEKLVRENIVKALVRIQYERNEMAFTQGTFRFKGEVLDIYPAYEEFAIRIEMDEDNIKNICIFHPISGDIIKQVEKITIYPAKHFVISRHKLESAISDIEKELALQVEVFQKQDKLVEAQRLKQRTEFDIEMMREIGYCNGIENYSRHLSSRAEGERPFCLLDYFPKPFLVAIDESHIAVPQIRAMYNGDRARKTTLIEHGFRLPSSLDNRPLKFEEFEKIAGPVIYVSATPSDYELSKANGVIVEQIIRPTGLVDPKIEVRPVKGMIEDVFNEIKNVAGKGERVLITTLTKRFSEDLAQYMEEHNFRARYMHSGIDALERVKIITEFRQGKFDCLIGINLLREGLDLPEVSLVVIMDADKEGFLRSDKSLIQTCGRAARNINGRIIMYADTVTGSMERAISEMERRRNKQNEYNKKHGITPKTIVKYIDRELLEDEDIKKESFKVEERLIEYGSTKKEIIARVEKEMKQAAEDWDFERAAELRERLFELQGKKGRDGGSKGGSKKRHK
ncbi:MAG: excinuclease ABC subunit UvrB [Elusimicrobiota bacterium]